MILRELTVRNIRSHAQATVAFGEGTTLLAGDIGSGKTSLLLAIEMALFGFTEVESAHLVRHGSEAASVEVSFNDEGQIVSLRRTFRSRTSGGRTTYAADEGSFSRDGARTRHSPSELKQWAIELLGFPDNPAPQAHSDLWRWAVYVPQERMRSILEARPDDRLQTVRKALGVENYRQAAENAREVARALRQRVKVVEARAEALSSAAGDRAALNAEKAPLRQKLAEAVDRESKLNREHAELAQRLAQAATLQRDLTEAIRLRGQAQAEWDAVNRELEGALRREQAAKAAVDVALAEQQSLESRSSNLTKDLPDLGALEEVHRKSLEARKVATAANAEFTGAKEREAQVHARLEGIKAQVARAREAVAKREATLQSTRRAAPPTPPSEPSARPPSQIAQEAQTIQTELNRVREELGGARHEEGDLEELLRTGSCPRCHQPVDAATFDRHLLKARSARESGERRSKELDARLLALETERVSLQDWEKARDRWEVSTRQLREAETELAMARDALENIVTEEGPAGTALAEARGHLARLATAPQTARAAELEEERSRSALDDARRRHEEKRSVQEKLDDLRRRLEETRQQVADLGAEVTRLRASITLHDRQRGERHQEEQRLREALRPYETLEEQRGRLEGLLREQLRVKVACEKDLEAWERRSQEAERSAEAAAQARTEAANLQGQGDWLQTSFVGLAETLEARALVRSQTDFDTEFRRMFQTLVEDADLRATIDATFTPTVLMDGVPTPPEALSGGERTALALAFRLALGSTVRRAQRLRLDTLILDEPTDGFSAEQVTKLADLFRELDRRQIIIVSHEAALEGLADHVVRLEKTGGVSRILQGAGSSDGPGASQGPRRSPSPKASEGTSPEIREEVPRP